MHTYVAQNLMLFVCIGVFLMFPYPQVLSGGSEDILPCALDVRDPHDFSRWKLMLKFIDFLEAIMAIFIKAQVYDVHLIVHGVSIVAGHCHPELIILPISESDGVILKVAIISVSFLGLSQL